MHKACAVVLHPDGAPLRLLGFTHPLAGPQLVKGGIRPDEAPAPAAARELFEESGLETVSAVALGQSDQIVAGQTWHFVLCRAKTPVRNTWQHYCADDGGHLFRFFWFAPDAPPAFSAPHAKAFDWIMTAI